jgi:predicted HicB family RNase H-like nuclease
MTEVAQQTFHPETTIFAQPDSNQPIEPPTHEFTGDKRQEVFRVASELFRQGPDWVTFFREVLGVDGVARRLFSEPEEYLAFEKSEQYTEIQQMLAKLRGRNSAIPDDQEPTRVITVRLPKSLHESLRAEAHDRNTSMNKLCITKLLQVMDDELAPIK